MKGLLEEGGKTSSMRAGMFLAVVTGCAVALMGIYAATKPDATIDLVQVSFLSGSLVTAGLGIKAWQKGKEQ